MYIIKGQISIPISSTPIISINIYSIPVVAIRSKNIIGAGSARIIISSSKRFPRPITGVNPSG